MSKWTEKKLDDVADIKLSNVNKKTKDNERRILLCNYTDVYRNNFITRDMSKNFMIASCSESEFSKFRLKGGQVAITKDSETPNDIGIPTYITDSFDDTVLGYHLSLITPNNEKLDGKFLNYYLLTMQAKRYFENNSGGSGQRCSLALDIIKSIPLRLPKLEYQICVGELLYKLDLKIELNNKINAELESMAKLLYDYWFVQYDFPDANGKPYKSSGGKMVYNEELGREIPEGWVIVKLKFLADNVVDSLEPGEHLDLPYLPIDRLPMKKLYYDEYENRNEAKSSLIKFQQNDILLGAMRVYFHRICNAVEDGISRSTIMVIRPKKVINKNYILLTLNRVEAIEFATNNSTGSSIPYAKWRGGIANYQFSLPYDEKILTKFNNIITPIFDNFKNYSKQNNHLNKLRDFLLPMLMNGQVSVK